MCWSSTTATTPPARDPRARTPWIAGAAALFAVAALALFWALRPPTRATPAASASAPIAARAAVDGSWQAALEYDWPNARYTERFVLGGEGRELHGSASFVGVPRGVLEGAVEGDTLRFVTRTQQTGAPDLMHHYRARLVGDEQRFVMKTEGATSTHSPVRFVAKRLRGKP